MARGFIRNPLDIRLLILYILNQLILPVSMAELTDLALCDEGINYFQFATALSGLTENGHVKQTEDGQLSITQRGRSACVICATELPYSVRTKCDQNTQLLNKQLKRRNQIRTSVTPIPLRESYTAELVLDDDAGNIMTLNMTAPDRGQADLLASGFQRNAERVYQAILTTLLGEENG